MLTSHLSQVNETLLLEHAQTVMHPRLSGPLTLKHVPLGFLCVDVDPEGSYTRRREKGL